MSFSFDGPSPTLYQAIAGGMIVGALYSAIAKTSSLSIVIFAVRELADSMFYRLASIFFQPSNDRNKAKIYAATNLTVNVGTLLALRRLEFIGKLGTQIFLGIMAIEMTCKFADFSKYRVDDGM